MIAMKFSAPSCRRFAGSNVMLMDRRFILTAALAMAASALGGCQTTTSPDPALAVRRDSGPDPTRPVTLIYIRSPVCPYCLDWERTAEPRWLASPERARLTYRVLEFAHFRNIAEDSGWPEDLRWVRDRERLSRGTPRFIVIRDDDVLISAFGTGSWERDVLPVIRRAVT